MLSKHSRRATHSSSHCRHHNTSHEASPLQQGHTETTDPKSLREYTQAAVTSGLTTQRPHFAKATRKRAVKTSQHSYSYQGDLAVILQSWNTVTPRPFSSLLLTQVLREDRASIG